MTTISDELLPESVAIADIIDEFYVKKGLQFDFLILSKDLNNSVKFSRIVNEVVRRNKNQYQTTVFWYEDTSFWEYEFLYSAIILADPEFLKDFNLKVFLMNPSPVNLKFLLLSSNYDHIIMNEHLFYESAGIHQFQYFLFDRGEKLQFVTYEWYKENNCNIGSETILNDFDKKSSTWSKKLENFEKFTNYHGCLMTLSTVNYEPNFDYVNKVFKGHYIEVFQALAKVKNFTFYFDLRKSFRLPIYRNWRFEPIWVYPNIEISTLLLLEGFRHENHFTTTFGENRYILFTSPGELYTNYEKMLLPFDYTTWWFLIATFAAAFAIISVVNLLPQRIKEIIYGEGVRMPAFNVTGTFFGIGQIKLPKNNFARIILITFIFFCLVIRVAYQGVQFEMMTSEMRKKAPQTIKQLYDENYTFWGEEYTFGLNVLERLLKRTAPTGIKANEYTFKDVQKFCHLNASVKMAVVWSHEELQYNNAFCHTKLNVLPENVLTMPFGFGIAHNHHFFFALEDFLQKTIPFGIPQWLFSTYMHDHHKLPVIPPKEAARILKFENLSFGFVIWLVACGVSTLGLLCEILTKYFCRGEIVVSDEAVQKRKVKPAVIQIADGNLGNELGEPLEWLDLNIPMIVRDNSPQVLQNVVEIVDEKRNLVESDEAKGSAVKLDEFAVNLDDLAENFDEKNKESLRNDDEIELEPLDAETSNNSLMNSGEKSEKSLKISDEIEQIQQAIKTDDKNHSETPKIEEKVNENQSKSETSQENDVQIEKIAETAEKHPSDEAVTDDNNDDVKSDDYQHSEGILQLSRYEIHEIKEEDSDNTDVDDVFEPKWEDDLNEYY